MRKMFMAFRLFILAMGLMTLGGTLSCLQADDRFAITIGTHDNLVVFGPKGERAADVDVPTISQEVTVGATTFQLSFGRDANDMLTAILAPNPGQPQDLHFSVMGRTVDADKAAVVTLAFPNSNRVTIDPGYVGSVVVDARTIRHHELADVSAPPRPMAHHRMAPEPMPAPVPRTTADVQPRELPPPMTPEAAPAASTPAPVTHDAPPNSAPSMPAASGASSPPMPPPLTGSSFSSPPPAPLQASGASSSNTSSKLYWSEPVTPPDGPAPTVASDQMKLIEITGPVSITLSNGRSEPAEDGMILPSGATVSTADDASAAVFMGGVNSVRFLPDSEAKVSQKMTGTVRHTAIDLSQGTVFSRVGRRPGETQDYLVKTPEGVAAARGTEFADHRGKGSDGKMHHYVFVAKGLVECFVDGQVFKAVAGTSSSLGSTAMPPAPDTAVILHSILVTLQPFNLKLAGVLVRVADGTATAADSAFYNTLVNVFFDTQLPSILNQYGNVANPLQYIVPAARRALNQDLEPFGTNPLTHY